jgi:hypothetical protein
MGVVRSRGGRKCGGDVAAAALFVVWSCRDGSGGSLECHVYTQLVNLKV